MTLLAWVALVGFIIGCAGIPLVILAGDLIAKLGRKKPEKPAVEKPAVEKPAVDGPAVEKPAGESPAEPPAIT